MFLLVPAYRGSPGQKAVKRLCVCVTYMELLLVVPREEPVGTVGNLYRRDALAVMQPTVPKH